MAINYTEKGAGLHEAITAAGHWLAQVDGVWQSSDEVAVQAIIDGYTLADACKCPIVQVKSIARGKILTFLPDWKQSNNNARMNELNEVRFSRPLTIGENAEIAAMRALWERAKAIRVASDTHEAALLAFDSFAAVQAYDIHTGWPE